MKLVWPTRSRTGSQFVLNLTTAWVGYQTLVPQARINGHRVDAYRREEKTGRFSVADGLKYLEDNNIQSMKYEDPGKDDFIRQVADRWPEAKFVASYRSLERVISSHYNIESWGHDEADVIYQFSASLELYEWLFKQNRLLMIDVTNPADFSVEKVEAFLGAAPSAAVKKTVAEWQPTNTLEYQKEKGGDKNKDVVKPPRIERLFDIHPWAPAIEARYRAICAATSQKM